MSTTKRVSLQEIINKTIDDSFGVPKNKSTQTFWKQKTKKEDNKENMWDFLQTPTNSPQGSISSMSPPISPVKKHTNIENIQGYHFKM